MTLKVFEPCDLALPENCWLQTSETQVEQREDSREISARTIKRYGEKEHVVSRFIPSPPDNSFLLLAEVSLLDLERGLRGWTQKYFDNLLIKNMPKSLYINDPLEEKNVI